MLHFDFLIQAFNIAFEFFGFLRERIALGFDALELLAAATSRFMCAFGSNNETGIMPYTPT